MTLERTAFACLALALASFTASANTLWVCEFEGSYAREGEEPQPLAWRTRWSPVEGGWSVAGSHGDDGGESIIDGLCDQEKCLIRQLYQFGPRDGNEVFWAAEYEPGSEGQPVGQLAGVWGAQLTAEGGEGDWQAQVDCTQ